TSSAANRRRRRTKTLRWPLAFALAPQSGVAIRSTLRSPGFRTTARGDRYWNQSLVGSASFPTGSSLLGERTAGPHIRCWAEAVSPSYPLRTQVDGSILLRPLVHRQRTNSPVIFLWQGLEKVHDRLPFLDLHRGTGSSAMHRLILLDGSFWGEQIRPA